MTFRGAVNMIIDKDTPYGLLQSIIFTTTQAEFRLFLYAVRQ